MSLLKLKAPAGIRSKECGDGAVFAVSDDGYIHAPEQYAAELLECGCSIEVEKVTPASPPIRRDDTLMDAAFAAVWKIMAWHPRDGEPGRNGKDADQAALEALLVAEVQERIALIPPAKNGEPGKRGLQGQPGQQGQIGPMPKHEWSGTQLRFEMRPGVWGQFVDLRGPDGGGLIGGGPINIDPLIAAYLASNPTQSNSYFPAGW